MADVLGSRRIFLAGCFLYAVFTLASGVSQTSLQLIIFRAMQGISIAACLPSAVGILSHSFPTGSTRNLGFAILGAGQPVGFASGMVLSGVFISKLSWRWAFYCSAIVNLFVLAAAAWGLPTDKIFEPITFKSFWRRVDWIGAMLVSTSLGMFFYVLAIVADSPKSFISAVPIAFTVLSGVMFPGFLFWERWQEKNGKVCIMPLAVWKNRSFAAVCINVFFAWAAFNGVQYFVTLTFQEVQHLSPTTTSLYFIPCVIAGALTNIAAGLLVSRVKANRLALFGALASTIAPILLANMNIEWSYWRAVFWAMCLIPLSADILYTISNLAITSLFPSRTQALAGGVFNTLAQIGNSVGLAITSIVAASVTAAARRAEVDNTGSLWAGYRASFWTCFGACIVSSLICAGGMRGLGKVGLKVE
jgi:MFS family permease